MATAKASSGIRALRSREQSAIEQTARPPSIMTSNISDLRPGWIRIDPQAYPADDYPDEPRPQVRAAPSLPDRRRHLVVAGGFAARYARARRLAAPVRRRPSWPTPGPTKVAARRPGDDAAKPPISSSIAARGSIRRARSSRTKNSPSICRRRPRARVPARPIRTAVDSADPVTLAPPPAAHSTGALELHFLRAEASEGGRRSPGWPDRQQHACRRRWPSKAPTRLVDTASAGRVRPNDIAVPRAASDGEHAARRLRSARRAQHDPRSVRSSRRPRPEPNAPSRRQPPATSNPAPSPARPRPPPSQLPADGPAGAFPCNSPGRPPTRKLARTSSRLDQEISPRNSAASTSQSCANLTLGSKTVYRVRITGLSSEDANTLCARLKAGGGPVSSLAIERLEPQNERPRLYLRLLQGSLSRMPSAGSRAIPPHGG